VWSYWVYQLPAYAPELNPVEPVWNNVKNDRIGRSVIMSADDLKAKAIGALRRLQKLPGIVRGFLRDPKLAYILELHPGTARRVYKGISSLVSLACDLALAAGAARATATAARRPGTSTVTTLMMASAVCGRTMLAVLRHAAWLTGCRCEGYEVRELAALTRDRDGDVVADGLVVHPWQDKSRI
jgi:hypothetical protein